ncbi:serine/threonine-protein kinase [Gandjariella thermophila]|uniref:non-specific serine/threonine protein kinase n=1 Tax=Gandjariella thermophila TaxID=1931992 RepID=A0A4D4JFG2_9PSEU|nr:serine/threonine-protein kinase [Gandjariella thermophila]GDY33398.1 hypothetical protein GTS_50310 [Gandjariella thermophila]
MQLFHRRRHGDERPEDVPGYRDLQLIGRGGFSVVYRATQEALDRAVALKVLTVPLDEDARRRFFREVTTTARLTGHPNVVTALDAGRTRTGRPYLAMDLYSRGSLMDRLNAEGPLPATEVARIGAKIADALDAAHQLGIVHRDVKPNNILVSRFGEPALADFGVACLLDLGASATVLETFTPSHAAPEVVNRQPPSAASDVYALGSTMYQLVAGQPAFGRRGEEIAAVLHRILTEEPAALACPELPPLADVVRRAMAKRPEDRHPSAAALAAALRSLVSDAEPRSFAPQPPPWAAAVPGEPRSGGAHPATPVGGPSFPDTPPGESVWHTAGPARPRRRRMALTVVGVLVAVAALTVGLAAWQRALHGEARPQAQSAATSTADPTVPASAAPGATTVPVTSVAGGAPAGPAPPAGRGTTPGAPPPPAATTVTSAKASSSPAEQPTSVCTPDGCAARASFVAYGDHLYVCDNKADGHSAVAWYQRSDVPGQNNEAWDNNGSGTCIDHNMNMPEGAKITYRVCVGDYDTRRLLVCSNTITATG